MVAVTGSTVTIVLVVAAISATTVISVSLLRRKSRYLQSRLRELEISLKASMSKCASERQGRIKTQQALRKALQQQNSEKLELISYPMTPIAIIQSCFPTRNGTPRQPLLVPLARACLVFDSAHIPPAALEGLGEYSHCWIIYVFHLNTDLEKLWKEPSKSRFKAKVRVPRLKGGRMGVFATRSPHRPCPIGLTVAKVEAVQGNMILLSGVDLVDGTPVLDVKPYLPYCDSIEGATVPKWVTEENLLAVSSVNFSKDFTSTLASCWMIAEKKSLYASLDELRCLIKQVLTWDIRSVSQRNRPHNAIMRNENHKTGDRASDLEDEQQNEAFGYRNEQVPLSYKEVTYHLLLEGLDISYRIDNDGDVVVEKAILSSGNPNSSQNRCNYMTWRDKLV